jgi:CheY-like chemotaxis protein
MEPIPEPKIISSSDDAHAHLLIAEDHDSARTALGSLLEWKGFTVTTVADGNDALKILTADDAPSIALLDWEMPGMSGPDICRAVRSKAGGHYRYLIIITAREGEEDIAEAMAAGADDFVSKPFGVPEVVARIRNGQRTLRLERSLAARIEELEHAMETAKQLKRLLPICAYCKSIRDDTDYWQEIEQYIHKHTGTDFTHGICPACMEKVLKEQFGDPTAADIAEAKAQEQPPG